MFGLCSVSEPFSVNYKGGQSGTTGRSVRDPRAVGAESTLVLVGVGQSNIANSQNATYSPAHGAKIDNLNIYDGGLYGAADPLLGASTNSSGGNWLLRLADKLIDDGYCDRVILAPIAAGNTAVADWAPGGTMNASILAISKRIDAMGAIGARRAYLWVQGENDTGLGTTQVAYQAALGALILGLRATGDVAPWMLGKSTYTGGVTSVEVRAAISASVNGTDILVGADTDSLTGGTYRYDVVHYTAVGADVVAGLWRDQIVSLGV